MLWYCWFGHMTRKIVSKMTYNVSSGTLNPTILYHANEGAAADVVMSFTGVCENVAGTFSCSWCCHVVYRCLWKRGRHVQMSVSRSYEGHPMWTERFLWLWSVPARLSLYWHHHWPSLWLSVRLQRLTSSHTSTSINKSFYTQKNQTLQPFSYENVVEYNVQIRNICWELRGSRPSLRYEISTRN